VEGREAERQARWPDVIHDDVLPRSFARAEEGAKPGATAASEWKEIGKKSTGRGGAVRRV
jgi:hypothetical protein